MLEAPILAACLNVLVFRVSETVVEASLNVGRVLGPLLQLMAVLLVVVMLARVGNHGRSETSYGHQGSGEGSEFDHGEGEDQQGQAREGLGGGIDGDGRWERFE